MVIVIYLIQLMHNTYIDIKMSYTKKLRDILLSLVILIDSYNSTLKSDVIETSYFNGFL